MKATESPRSRRTPNSSSSPATSPRCTPAEPALWVHGHMHDPVDEWVGDTRIIANPHGYSRVEGHTFNPTLVLKV